MSRSLKVAILVSLAMAALVGGLIQHGRVIRESFPLRALPHTARAVFRVDTAALGRTPAAQVVLDAAHASEQLTEIEAACKIAPLEALGEVVVWVQGPDEQPFQSVGLILRGRTVTAPELAECHRELVAARGGSVARLDVVIGPVLTSPDGASALAALDDRTVVTGSVQTVAETMEVERGLMPALSGRAPLASLWRQMARHAAFAAVLEPPAHWKNALRSLAGIQDGDWPLEGMSMLGVTIRSGSERWVEAEIRFTDTPAVPRHAEEIDQWLHHPPESVVAPWRDVMRSAQVESDGATIWISFDVSALARSR